LQAADATMLQQRLVSVQPVTGAVLWFATASPDQQAHQSLSGSGSSTKPSTDGSSQHQRHDKAVEKDGLYWTAKYMADATASATAADPHWGLEGGMTPLAAVFVAKWRQQVGWQAAGIVQAVLWNSVS
jgi:hypothetical protein